MHLWIREALPPADVRVIPVFHCLKLGGPTWQGRISDQSWGVLRRPRDSKSSRDVTTVQCSQSSGSRHAPSGAKCSNTKNKPVFIHFSDRLRPAACGVFERKYVFEFKMFRAEFHQQWTKKPPLHTRTLARSWVSLLVDQNIFTYTEKCPIGRFFWSLGCHVKSTA